MSVYLNNLSSDFSFPETFTIRLTGIIDQLLADYNFGGGEVGVIFADNSLLQSLNSKYRDRNTPTDVLSFSYLEPADQFPGGEKEFAVGDIYISVERARDQAKEVEQSLVREVTFLTVHGMLHLLGFSHSEENDAKLMQAKERVIMEKYDQTLDGGEINA